MRGLARWLLPGRAAWGLSEAACPRLYSTDLPESLLPVVAIVGRPNVGKSALFNRLVRRREAVVHDTPGGHVTRDYQEGVARLADLRFKVVDTSGLEPFLPSGTIQARATQLTAKVLNKSDVTLFLIDGITGALPGDAQLAQWLRKTMAQPVGSKVVMAANKCERRGVGNEATVAATLAECSRLGFGEPVALSAMTGEGMTDLYAVLQPLLDPIVAMREAAVRQIEATSSSRRAATAAAAAATAEVAASATSGAAEAGSGGEAGVAQLAMSEGQQQQQQLQQRQEQLEGTSSSGGSGVDTSNGPLRIAIMGLPNVGKSTLTNWLLQDERCLTGPEPGLTRDAIKERIEWEGHDIELVDTAGWIRKTKLANYDESGGAVAEQTVAEARSVMQFVHVVALLVDAERALQMNEGLTHREVTLASDVVAEGRLLLIVANKLDAMTPDQREKAMGLIRHVVEDSLPDVSGVPIIGMSALTGRGAEQLLPAALTMYERWNQRVPTSKLNKWVEKKAAEYQTGGGKELNRISYMSQVKARPPTFIAWVSGSTPLSVSSRRFIASQIRKQFEFSGVPIRITIRLKPPRKDRQRSRR